MMPVSEAYQQTHERGKEGRNGRRPRPSFEFTRSLEVHDSDLYEKEKTRPTHGAGSFEMSPIVGLLRHKSVAVLANQLRDQGKGKSGDILVTLSRGCSARRGEIGGIVGSTKKGQ